MMSSAICAFDACFSRSRSTGKERDPETGEQNGNDYFGARYYASSMGRFMSPDWSAIPAAVPYAKLENPQTLNLYAYVGNNPLGRVDKDGHDDYTYDQSGKQTGYVKRGFWHNFFQGNSYTLNADNGKSYSMEAALKPLSGGQRYTLVGAQKQNDNSSTSSSTTGQDQSHYASVSYWPKGAGGFGHIGIGVDTDDTQGFSTKDPSLHWWQRLFGAPAARTEDDIAQHTTNGDVAPHSYLHIPVSAAQAQAMQASMADRKANPGHYNLLFNNCAGFVESVLHAGGVSGVPHAEIFGPPVLYGVLAYDNSFR